LALSTAQPGVLVSEKEVRRQARVEWLEMKRHLPLEPDVIFAPLPMIVILKPNTSKEQVEEVEHPADEGERQNLAMNRQDRGAFAEQRHWTPMLS